jgi:adenine-specific DNA-methyltransferase
LACSKAPLFSIDEHNSKVFIFAGLIRIDTQMIMTTTAQTPQNALNKAFRKVKPNRTDMERFKTNLIQLLDHSNDAESEEFHKNLVSDFLKKTWYEPHFFINTKGRNDLVIHNGDSAKWPVGVIVEAKKPTNKAEMPANGRLNVKAFHELVLYYLRERIAAKNVEVRHLVITNMHEWYIFDSVTFERTFAQNKNLVKQFQDFEEKRLADTKTDFFYKHIAEPFIAALETEVEYTYFNLNNYAHALRNADKTDDKSLIALYKVLSPEHLLKRPFVNDSNSLDRRFYSELLHIIGLTEHKEGGKKLIDRLKEGERLSGSILEDTIIQLDSLDKINRLAQPAQFGATHAERLFNVALELSITWINRILFLKLLEGQLVAYHRGNRAYTFLNSEKLREYDDLNGLFFQVLAKKQAERNSDVSTVFAKVPYLNSSLFEPTELEHQTIFISNLKDDKTIPLHRQTVLRDAQGKTRTGSMRTLEYLFHFLDAYDFSSEGAEDIQEDNKTLINASVLGLIFEKINGYKDGSFFTPGFITMYMCRESIRRAVIQKFNTAKGWNCADIDELYDKIEDRTEANKIVNSLRICDPAVGSGHFLVSALNEIIALKSDLRILQDRQGRRLKEYSVEVVNDELIITDENGGFFEYLPTSVESQRVQETLFHEKQSIIENCLFGVDINPNSVKICRLRLWIELLKNAYYKSADELETLPNIDINIKCGNSLVSRFALDADLKKALKSLKYDIHTYRGYVRDYHHATSKEVKRGLNYLINQIKNDFRTEIGRNDPLRKRLDKLASELYHRFTGNFLFEPEVPYGESQEDLNKKRATEQEKLEKEIAKITAEIETAKANRMFENAFEWRFEFPEVLNDEGDFIGFDVVLGNPPYIRQEELAHLKGYLQQQYQTFTGTADLYVYFVERGMQVLREGGEFSYILPNKWMRAGYGDKLRQFVRQRRIIGISDFGDLPVFDEATTYPCVLELQRNPAAPTFKAANIPTLQYPRGLRNFIRETAFDVPLDGLQDSGWTLTNQAVQQVLDKLRRSGKPLGEYVEGKIYRGVLTGLNEAFVIDADTRTRLLAEDPNSAEVIKPFLAGRDIKRYQTPKSDKFLILFEKGVTNAKKGDKTPEKWLETTYPAIYKHLLPFETAAKKRYDKGDYWWELRACDYYGEFEKTKIIYQEIMTYQSFTCENTALITNNKIYFIPNSGLELLGLLNSKLIWFYLNQVTSKLQGGALALQSPFVLSIPIPKNYNSKETAIETLVNQILALKQSDPTADTAALEQEIDVLVYGLYGLTAAEVAIVEGKG